MGKRSRTKGATYEREIASTLQKALGVEVKRRLGQAREGGEDIDLTTLALPLTLECKRRAQPLVALKWLEQAQAASEGKGSTPVVITRGDNSPSLVVMTLDDWLAMFTKALAWALTEEALDETHQ
jgi:Holliday junction resolvase